MFWVFYCIKLCCCWKKKTWISITLHLDALSRIGRSRLAHPLVVVSCCFYVCSTLTNCFPNPFITHNNFIIIIIIWISFFKQQYQIKNNFFFYFFVFKIFNFKAYKFWQNIYSDLFGFVTVNRDKPFLVSQIFA